MRELHPKNCTCLEESVGFCFDALVSHNQLRAFILVKTAHEFWKDFKNHQETKRQLFDHGLLSDAELFETKVAAVTKCWISLANIHLNEAKVSCNSSLKRSFYSRNYYAVYNASKSVRYIVNGSVSSRGDDHQKMSELPEKFPDYANWGSVLRKMYEFRLIADYDGWPNSLTKLDSNMVPHLTDSTNFIRVSKKFLRLEFGIKL